MLIKYLLDAKFSFNSYTMNQASIACGSAALEDRKYFEENLRKIIRTRERAKEEFARLGFCCLDSKANFLFVTHPEYSGEELFQALKEEGIYVRFWGSPRIEDYLRVTIGTEEEMEILFEFLRNYMKK